MEESKHVLHLAVSIGVALLKNGAEIYRVQETMIRILDAYEIKDYHVFVLSSGIFATVNETKDDASSMVRYIPLGETNLGRIASVNQLSREICEHQCTIGEARTRLESCEKSKVRGLLSRLLCTGMGCTCFCYVFGGKLIDCMVACVLGMLLQTFVYSSQKKGTSKFIVNIIGSGMVTAGSLLLTYFDLGIMHDKVVSGSIVILLPGVVLTTAIRELFNGDYLSGSIKLIDALLMAFCIAIGVGGAMKLYQLIAGGIF